MTAARQGCISAARLLAQPSHSHKAGILKIVSGSFGLRFARDENRYSREGKLSNGSNLLPSKWLPFHQIFGHLFRDVEF